MKPVQRLLPLTLASLLAACATPPASGPSHSNAAVPVAPNPPTTGQNIGSALPAQPGSSASATSPAEPTADVPADVWDRLRGSFAMADCDADPEILSWARRYTANPQRFEAQMRQALPQINYVQQVADKYDVAGEFVMLPWVESQYHAGVSSKHNSPSGMWQLVGSTAHVLGLHSSRNYDGRLDTAASTDSVMHMLSTYHEQLQDWRLVDYAYNRGEFVTQKQLNEHGALPAEPAIPSLSVPRGTREHLTKLLAISCVVREPGRFHVELPTLAPEQHLEVVKVEQPMSVTHAATGAGMDADSLKRLNPAILGSNIDAGATTLLMPQQNAAQFRSAMQLAKAQGMSASLTDDAPSFPQDNASDNDAPSHHGRTHTVRNGESLWQIAHKYSVSVSNLQRFNHLHGNTVKPGEVLKLDSP